MSAPVKRQGERGGDKGEGHERRENDKGSGDGRGMHDSSNRKERQGDDKGIPKEREEAPKQPTPEDPSNRIERDNRTPYDNSKKPGNEGGSSGSGSRVTIAPSAPMSMPKSKEQQKIDKMMEGKGNVDERTGKLDPHL